MLGEKRERNMRPHMRIHPAVLPVFLVLIGCSASRAMSWTLIAPGIPNEEARELKPLEIVARNHAYAGDELKVRILSAGLPVWVESRGQGKQAGGKGVHVTFGEEARETDAEGYAVFKV